jgi:HK97 family phage prohead protease/HK97 family phage major capsid protein
MLERDAAEWAGLNDRQKKQAQDQVELVAEFGQFDQGTDANGAHYAPADANPFKAEGLACGNCIFYNELTRQCQIVEGNIEAEAVCKLWIIPESSLQSQRSETMEMETRDIELRLDNAEQRTITGLAVPFNQDANIGGAYIERFAPGSITDVTDVKLFYGHETPIGVVTAGRDTADGFEITAKVSDTSLGNDVLTLMRDGALNKFSVGFVPVEQTRDGQTITRTKVFLKEVSVVPFAAYSGANITEVREENLEDIQTPQIEGESVSENIELDVRTVQDEVAELRRVVEAGITPSAPVAPGYTMFRSVGEYAKGLVSGDENAVELFRTAATSSNTYSLPGWVGFINNLIDLNRPSWNVWSRGVLPAAGLTVDYAKVTTNGATVGNQATENTAISSGNITIANVSSAVKTYAGQTQLSRQLVERSSTPYLDTAFQAMAIAYAGTTNAAVVSALAGLTWTGKIMDADGGTAQSILEGITDGAKYIKVNSGLSPEFILCDPVAYKYLVSIADTTGRPIVRLDGGMANGESIGFAAPAQLSGSIFGLPIIVDTTLSAGVAYLANSAAVKVFESAGAPVRLVDDISGQSTLTNSYAVYGYAAITVPFEGAIVKLDVTA